MLLYLPCSRFRVRYTLSIGMPFSKLDRLILRSVNDGVHTVEGLSDVFKLNNNVLVQSLITLIQAGWLVLGNSPEVQFSLTRQGVQAIDTKQIPKSIVYRQETAEILLEHVSGGVIPKGEVIYRNFRYLEIKEPWNNPQVLRPEVTKKAPEQGEVQDLLPMRLEERLHWIQDIQRVSKDFECIPLDVDIENGKIINFPSHRNLFLQEKIIGYAEKILEQQHGQDFHFNERKNLPFTQKNKEETVFILPHDQYELSWNPNNLLTNSQEFSASLLGVFEQAHKYVIIASREMKIGVIMEIEGLLLMAIKRGVKVTLLWGNSADKESLDYLGKLVYKIEQENMAGQLSYNNESCNFNISLVLFDRDNLAFDAIIGNYSWLSSSIHNITGHQIGFRINHPEIIARLARIVGGYAGEFGTHGMQEVASQWKHIAANISSSSVSMHNDSRGEGAPIKVRLVQSTNDHLDALIEFTTSSTKRFYILSTSIDTAGGRRLQGNIKFGDPDVESIAVVGTPEEISSFSKMPEVNKLYEMKAMNINVIATEEAICITSCPPLLGMDLERTERNLGIVIYGEDFAKAVISIIKNIISTTNNPNVYSDNG